MKPILLSLGLIPFLSFAENKQNIILILVDDMGWADLSCNGSSFYETPNIDRLAEQGIFFTHAYAAAPVSSPARGAIMSGKYPSRTGYTGLSGQWGRPTKGRLVDADFVDHLPLTEYTIAEALRSNGYATIHIGKWHLGEKDEYSPLNQGFDTYKTGFEGSVWKEERFNEKGEFITDVMTDNAIKLIEAHQSESFFLNLWYYAVHTPIRAKEKDIFYFKEKAKQMSIDTIPAFVSGEKYPAIPWFKQGKENAGEERIQKRIIQSDPIYAAFLYCLDQNIGRLMRSLKEMDLDEKTTVIFYSDNGGLSSERAAPTCNAPLREGKGWNFEGGIRVPLIVYSPFQIKSPGRTCASPVVGTDLYPTILDIVGLKQEPQQHVDGDSFFHLLQDKKKKRRPIFWHSPHYFNQGGYPFSCIIEDGWKYIYRYDAEDEFLFHISDDQSEQKNLISKKKGYAAHLKKKLNKYLKEVDAKFPAINTEETKVD